MNLNPPISLKMYVMCMIYLGTEHMCMSSFVIGHYAIMCIQWSDYRLQPWVLILNFYLIQEGKISQNSLTNKKHNFEKSRYDSIRRQEKQNV